VKPACGVASWRLVSSTILWSRAAQTAVVESQPGVTEHRQSGSLPSGVVQVVSCQFDLHITGKGKAGRSPHRSRRMHAWWLAAAWKRQPGAPGGALKDRRDVEARSWQPIEGKWRGRESCVRESRLRRPWLTRGFLNNSPRNNLLGLDHSGPWYYLFYFVTGGWVRVNLRFFFRKWSNITKVWFQFPIWRE